MTHRENSCEAGAGTEPATSSAALGPLGVEQAQDALLARATPIAGAELVATADALGRVLAEPVISTTDLPYWDNSAMDGYALRAADLADNPGWLPISQRIAAGQVGQPLQPGTAARIFTGAPTPEGADTVVVQEACDTDGAQVRVKAQVQPGANIRRQGEEVHAGAEVLAAGTRLQPQHLGMAAGVGAAQLCVRPRLKVAIFATGDELRMPGEPLGPGQIYNSNRFLYRALLQSLGCDVIDLGIVADDREATVAALSSAAAQADLILASGGVSVGEEDHIRPAVERLGHLHLWQVQMRPGKPFAFGAVGETPFLGSPGNPVSLFVTFGLFARPFIQRMQGITGPVLPQTLPALADFALDKPIRRRDYQRARLRVGDNGRALVEVFRSTSSAALSSLTWANGLVIIPEGLAIAPGDRVDFIPLRELIGQ